VIAVDCNVIVHLLVEGTQTPRARTLMERDADWHSEALVFAELTNVLVTAMRIRHLPLKDASLVLTQAEGVLEASVHSASHFDVLATAQHYRVSAYDARYLVVARNLGVKLVTDDAKLRKSAPDLTESLAEAVGY
jgi:predicted nucleic acid-binding protein